MKISGFDCDNKNCNYKDDSINESNYQLLLNKKCPECNKEMLTKRGFFMVKSYLYIYNNPLSNAISFVYSLYYKISRKKMPKTMANMSSNGEISFGKNNENKSN